MTAALSTAFAQTTYIVNIFSLAAMFLKEKANTRRAHISCGARFLAL